MPRRSRQERRTTRHTCVPAVHGGRLYDENLRSHLRFFAKHRGLKEAERARRLLLWSLRLRALVLRSEHARAGARFLSSGNARTLLDK